MSALSTGIPVECWLIFADIPLSDCESIDPYESVDTQPSVGPVLINHLTVDAFSVQNWSNYLKIIIIIKYSSNTQGCVSGCTPTLSVLLGLISHNLNLHPQGEAKSTFHSQLFYIRLLKIILSAQIITWMDCRKFSPRHNFYTFHINFTTFQSCFANSWFALLFVWRNRFKLSSMGFVCQGFS